MIKLKKKRRSFNDGYRKKVFNILSCGGKK